MARDQGLVYFLDQKCGFLGDMDCVTWKNDPSYCKRRRRNGGTRAVGLGKFFFCPVGLSLAPKVPLFFFTTRDY